MRTQVINMRLNRIKFDKLLLEWRGKVGAAHTFKGIHDYETWAMSQTPPEHINPNQGMMESLEDLEGFLRGKLPPEEGDEWMGPEEFIHKNVHYSTGNTEKDKLYNRAVMLRKQIDSAIELEDYEKAQLLQETLNVIKTKYDRL